MRHSPGEPAYGLHFLRLEELVFQRYPLGGPPGNPFFQFFVDLAYFLFDFSSLRDLARQSQIRLRHLRWAWDRDQHGHHWNQHQEGGHRRHGGDGFDHGVQAVDGDPDRDRAHSVRGAARQNEDAEGDEDTLERHVPTLSDEEEQQKRNRVVSGGNQAVGNYAEPKDRGIPEVAHAMGHEFPREELLEELEQRAIPFRVEFPYTCREILFGMIRLSAVRLQRSQGMAVCNK